LRKEGYDVEVFDFPQYGKKSAAAVEEYLNGNFGSLDEVTPYQASVTYAIDRFFARREIREALKVGKVVISNRYVSSSMIHQSGRIQDKKELDTFLSWLDHFEFELMNIPRPDKVFFLNVPFEIGYELVSKKKAEERAYIESDKKKDIHEQSKEHLKEAHTRACELVERFEDWEELKCTNEEKRLKSIEEIHEELHKRVISLLK
jgi:dTMP kinase